MVPHPITALKVPVATSNMPTTFFSDVDMSFPLLQDARKDTNCPRCVGRVYLLEGARRSRVQGEDTLCAQAIATQHNINPKGGQLAVS